jgi:polysaccharide biosynthesis/export protein
LAGGTMPTGSSRDSVDWANSFILRHGTLIKPDLQALVRRGNLSQNIYLQPDDFLYLRPQAPQHIYVMGAVNRVSAFPYTPRCSLLKAILLAGGTLPLSYGSHVVILRGSLTAPRIAIIDYKSIVKGKHADVLLEPDDIIYVPNAPYKYFVELGDRVIKQFVSTWALNEGRYAVSSSYSPVGVSVGVGK